MKYEQVPLVNIYIYIYISNVKDLAIKRLQSIQHPKYMRFLDKP